MRLNRHAIFGRRVVEELGARPEDRACTSTSPRVACKNKAAHPGIAVCFSRRTVRPARASPLTLNLTADTANRQLLGRLTGAIKQDGTTTPVDDDLTLAIPGDMDRTWMLQFQLAQAGRKVSGTALLMLSNGVTHAFVVRDRTGADGTAALSLIGDPTDPASKALSIRTTITPLEGGWARIESFSGKGYGQTVGW